MPAQTRERHHPRIYTLLGPIPAVLVQTHEKHPNNHPLTRSSGYSDTVPAQTRKRHHPQIHTELELMSNELNHHVPAQTRERHNQDSLLTSDD